MAASGSWTQIEAAPPQPLSSRRSGAASIGAAGVGAAGGPGSGGRSPVARLRRNGRPVLGALDGGGVALQRGAAAAILGSAVFLVPVMAINLLASRAAFDHFDDVDGSLVSVSQAFTGIDAATGVETYVTYITLIASSLAVALAGAYLALLVVRRAVGESDRPSTCLRMVARRLPAIVVAWAISHSWVLLADLVAAQASLADIAPLIVFLAPLVAWLVGLTVFVVPVLVAERLGPWASVRRALRLARARGGVVFAFSCACVLIGGGLRVVITYLPRLIEQTGLFSFGGFAWIAEGIASQLAQLVVVPLIGLSSAILYLQVRMDAEGMDLVLEAGRAFP